MYWRAASPRYAKVPANLLLLHQGEEGLRQRAVRLVETNPDLADHLGITERAMDVMDMLRQHYQANDDERDLVNAFHVDRTLTEKWLEADRLTLKRDFGPAAVGKILDDDAGRGRADARPSTSSSPRWPGTRRPTGLPCCVPRAWTRTFGPFSDLTALRAVLEEMGMLAPQAGSAFCIFLDTSIDACTQVAHYFLTGAMDYSGNYLGKPYSDGERAEVDRLFARPPFGAR